MRFRNPLGFTSGPVSFIISSVYIGIGAGLLYTHHIVPAAPESNNPVSGVDIAEAWRDLQHLSNSYHPYNSRRNDEVHDWLLTRVDAILRGNGVKSFIDNGVTLAAQTSDAVPAAVTIFNDLSSNTSFASGEVSVYFEGTNIIIYIRGSEDDSEDWWRMPTTRKDASRKHGVLVNAHYDSVSTGLGATDDGVGVISILQLIKYYTMTGNQPKRGIVALFNNGEEDFLNGAYAFTKHPISRFADTFLNLEGAGAGGRATLFRSTDAEVTRKYKRSPYPFGNVVSSDSFNRGLIRSQTDYVVFNGILGLRGLDVAFFEPRSKYHTVEDSARASSKASVWHMLSAALATMNGLTSDTTTNFQSDSGSRAVWFDILGRAFGLFNLQSLFAISVTLLAVTPIAILLLILLLQRFEKFYLFSTYAHSNPLDPYSPDETAMIKFGGWRGWTRFPISAGLASATVVGLAFLITGSNPLIIYSSQYAVWSMMLSAWFVVAWFFMRGADAMRPSALHRAHSLGWLFVLMWAILVACTVAENVQKIAGVYFLVIYFAAVFAALFVAYLEFFALPKKRLYVEQVSHAVSSNEPTTPRQRSSSFESNRLAIRDDRPTSGTARQEEDATETTSLLGKKRPLSLGGQSRQSEFVPSIRSVRSQTFPSRSIESRAYGDEQKWSGSLPSWLWILQFLLIGPISLILVGQVALFLSSSLHQTPADGSNILFIYICFSVLTIFLLLPTAPFLHRIPSRIPTFIFFVFVGTLIYNLLAFPFSEQNRLKVFFRQEVSLETGINHVSLTGLDGYVQQIISELPSADGQKVNCSLSDIKARVGLVSCKWQGLPPTVVAPSETIGIYKNSTKNIYEDWVRVKATSLNKTDFSTIITIQGRNTRACRLDFDQPIADFSVEGSSTQERKPRVGPEGAKQLRLWHREWEKPWTVRVRWEQEVDVKEVSGRAVCLWNDEGRHGVIPALDELKLDMPLWSVVTKLDDGLVMGYKRFSLGG